MGIVIQQSQKVLTEPLDRNKTGITHQVTASAIAYLVDRGLHPVETEVSVERSWIVDVAGFGYPIQNELKKLHLTGKRPIIPPISHIESYYLRYGSLLTAIIEVKTTRQDYLGDWKFKSKVYPANLCYLAYPKDLIKPEEIPEGWLGLEINLTGNTMLRYVGESRGYCYTHSHHALHPGKVIDFIAAIAVKLEYRERFSRHRTWWKMYRAGNI